MPKNPESKFNVVNDFLKQHHCWKWFECAWSSSRILPRKGVNDVPDSACQDLRQIRGSQQSSDALVQVDDFEFALSFLRVDPQLEERTDAGAVEVFYIRKVQHDAFGLSNERLNRVQQQRRSIRIDFPSAENSYSLGRLERVELQIVD